MDQKNLYRDIAERCEGDIYIGVVGPVRSGKSTFIKRFMELLVLPNIQNPNRRERAKDELPVSGSGKTITTIEPKFIPNEAAEVKLTEEAAFRVRLVDSVGYLIDGALGINEGEEKRMVRTPWFENDIPFEEAAEIGTRKVIEEHAAVGVVVTTDGTVTDIERDAYVNAEERVVEELKGLNKPFVILLNTMDPDSPKALALKKDLEDKYDAAVRAVNVEKMRISDLNDVIESLLFEFPLAEIKLDIPAWVSALDDGHYLVKSLIKTVEDASNGVRCVKDYEKVRQAIEENEFMQEARTTLVSLSEGKVDIKAELDEGLFFKILGEASGQEVEGEEHLLKLMKELVDAKREYDKVKDALASVRETGYGLVAPEMNELTLEEPQIVKQGSRFGVRLKAGAPSLHMIRVDIQTEVSPIVGTEKQSEELVKYLLSGFESDPKSLWETEIFGRSLSELVREGLSGKLMRMPDDVRQKVQKTLSKIINEGNGGIICILL
ncbi:MAG: stage IV sporulation protein A [Clostridia bacterium]|nr:stage IV sporulation protein A [Clostridia bacterium]MBQ4157461.1 stage IV sporulation protein A [Clostridia bacterium]